MNFYSPNIVSSDVYSCTLNLIDAIRNDDFKTFSLLIEQADLRVMDCAAINLAIHFERKEMLERMLGVLKVNEWQIQSPQGMILGFEENKWEIASIALPYLAEDALENILKMANTPEIIDTIDPYISSIKKHVAIHWCKNNQLHSLNRFIDKMELNVIQKTAIEAVNMNDSAMVEFFLNYFKDTQQDISNKHDNILSWAVSSSLDILKQIIPSCPKELYYKAIRKSISLEKYEYSHVLIENADLSNEEASEIFSLSTFKSHPKLCTMLVDRYPDCETRLSEALSCAVRGNDRVLFDRAFSRIDTDCRENLKHAMEAAWWASKRKRPEYLLTLSEKIDLNYALEQMHIATSFKFKEHHYDCLRDFLAQQQRDVISNCIGNAGGIARRKM